MRAYACASGRHKRACGFGCVCACEVCEDEGVRVRAQFRCAVDVDVGIGMFKFDASVCVLLTSSTFVCFRLLSFLGLCFVSVVVLNYAKIWGRGWVIFGVIFGLCFCVQNVMHFLNFWLIDLVIICMLIIFAEKFFIRELRKSCQRQV